jgi:hypothetical protein
MEVFYILYLHKNKILINFIICFLFIFIKKREKRTEKNEVYLILAIKHPHQEMKNVCESSINCKF